MFGLGSDRDRPRAPTDARELEDIVVRDWQGRDVRLGDAWAVEPALLVFLRHYG